LKEATEGIYGRDSEKCDGDTRRGKNCTRVNDLEGNKVEKHQEILNETPREIPGKLDR
jgi:hypothetical protein